MEKKKKLNFIFWAMAAHGKGLSGGDRIFIEFARRWSKRNPVVIYTWKEGKKMCKRQGLIADDKWLMIKELGLGPFCQSGFVVCYFARIIRGIIEAWKSTINYQPSTIVYSASEFWMDSLPALILKWRFPQVRWAAAWYQTAPNPIKGYKERGKRKERYLFSALSYWLAQLPIKPLISRYADFVLVNNEEEKKQFPRLNRQGRTIIVLGAVPLEEIRHYQSLAINHQPLPKVYDAVFQGRFHPQKGVLELIDIWKKVVEKKPGAKLAMIGDGSLMKSVKLKVKSEKLEKNIELFGYVFDGPKKYKIFSQSKIVVHPAFYDSGGMASAEAMAFGLPCVGFDLKAYETYYPQGMVKVKTGGLEAFAKAIIKLLGDKGNRQILGQEALAMIETNWSWDKRAKEVVSQIVSH